MFRISQIVTATELLKYFKIISNELTEIHEPLLVTQRCGKHLVLMSADFFEDLLSRTGASGEAPCPNTGIRDVIQGAKLGF